MSAEFFLHLVQDAQEYKGYTCKIVHRPSQNKLYYFSNESFPDSKSYYLKIFPDKPNEVGELPEFKIQRELVVSKLIREALGIDTPESIYLGTDESGCSAILQKEVRGLPFDTLVNGYRNLSRDTLMAIAYETGICLSRIHELAGSYFGDIGDVGNRFTNWADCFTQDTLRYLETGMNKGVLNPTHVEYFERRLSSPVLKGNNSPPSLCHNDFTPQNVIIDPESNRIAGIIDFEVAKYWIPEWDLTRVNAALEYPSVNRDLRDRFLEGYSSVGRMNLDQIKLQIEYYKPYESLHYWVWGWDKETHRKNIEEDIVRVTKIPLSGLNSSIII